MSSFTRLRPPATQPRKLVDEERCQQVTKIKTAKELLSTPLRAALLTQIKARANAPAGLYQKYYYELIETIAEFYQDLPGIVPPFNRFGGLLDHGLQRAAEVLEERRNHRLPDNNAPQEQVEEEYSQWTYMLFTVGLMRDIGKLHNCYQVYLCDSEGLMPRRWLPYEGAMNHHSNYYRFKLIDTEMVTLDPSQWDKRAGPNLAYKLMDSECFNWIHSNAAAYRIWWYELGDEEEEGRGGKGSKLCLDNAETKTIKIAMTMDNEAAIKEFIEKAEQEQAEKAEAKDLPTLTLDPTKVDLSSTTEVTIVVWAAEQMANNTAAASQIQSHNDGTVSISAAGVEAFAQSFPQLGDTAQVHAAVSSSQMNTANTNTATAAATTTAGNTATAAANQAAASATTANPVSQMNQSVAQQSTQSQIQQIVQKQTGAAAIAAVAAALSSGQANIATQAKMPQVESQASSVRMTMSMGG